MISYYYYVYADVYTIPVIKAKENYENILIGFQHSFAEINKLIKNPEVTVQGRKYNLLFFYAVITRSIIYS